MPFYFYHIPMMTNVNLSMRALLEEVEHGGRIPTFRGIKFTDFNMFDFHRCTTFCNGKYNMLFGRDECLLAGLAHGADGAIGSTFNIPFIVSKALLVHDALNRGDLESARQAQQVISDFIADYYDAFGPGTLKAVMELTTGIDLGVMRPPSASLDEHAKARLRTKLMADGFIVA